MGAWSRRSSSTLVEPVALPSINGKAHTAYVVLRRSEAQYDNYPYTFMVQSGGTKVKPRETL